MGSLVVAAVVVACVALAAWAAFRGGVPPLPPPPSPCASDLTCGPGGACVQGVCAACRGAADCAGGGACAPAGGCVCGAGAPPCAPGYACAGGQCLRACGGGALPPCPPGTSCAPDGLCRALCSSGTPCAAPGQQCLGGLCFPPPLAAAGGCGPYSGGIFGGGAWFACPQQSCGWVSAAPPADSASAAGAACLGGAPLPEGVPCVGVVEDATQGAPVWRACAAAGGYPPAAGSGLTAFFHG